MILFEKKNKYGSFNDLMDVSIETGDKWLDKKLNANICYGKGGGGSAPQDVPRTLRPYVKQVLDRAKGLYGSYAPQQLYKGERIMGFTPAEQAAQAGVAGMVERGISADPTLTSGATYYQPALGLLGESGELGRGAVQDITAEEIMGRMSPYQQAVTDIAKRKAAQEGQQYMTELGGQAARTGGFGGSRQAILEGMAASDLGQRLTDIQTTGSQSAYQDAVRAAEAQRARLAGGAQQAGALSQAFGALGQQALGQGYREQGYLAGIGEQERGLQQQRADLAYQQFVEQRDYPDVQLQKFSSLIQGFPFNFQQTPQQPSGFQQAVGTAATLGGLGRGLGFFNKGGKINGEREGGLSNVVYRQVGGSISDLFKQIEQEEDQEKKSKLIDEILYRTGASSDGTPRPATTIKEKYVPYSETDSPLSKIGKFIRRSGIEIGSIPSTLGSYVGNAATNLTTPMDILAQREARRNTPSLTDDGFTTAENLEQLYQSSDEATRKQIMAVNPEDVAAEIKKEGKEIKPIPAVKTEAAPIGANVVKTAEDVTGLQAILDKAFAFDKAAEEKAIKQQQGFDIAALGVQLMSTPLNQIDPALIRNLGVTNKELAGLDEKEAKQLLQKKLTELEIKKAEKELGDTDLVPLFPGIDSYVENLAGADQIAKLGGAAVNELISEAQKAASVRAMLEGKSSDSEIALNYLREELNKRQDQFKGLARNPKVGDDGLPLKAGNISGLLQAGLK